MYFYLLDKANILILICFRTSFMASQGTLNKVMLIGHTGDDVKMHFFENGGCVGNFPLATNESYINKSTGEQVTNTEWHNIVVRNKAAEVCEKYLKKGDKVFIEGRIRTRKYTDNNNVERYITEIICLDFTFLTPKEKSGANQKTDNSSTTTSTSTSQQRQNQQKQNQSTQNNISESEDEDDLPF